MLDFGILGDDNFRDNFDDAFAAFVVVAVTVFVVVGGGGCVGGVAVVEDVLRSNIGKFHEYHICSTTST
ncbi:Hypothetical predicted protein [Octopus vulgaris]|uniref:Uncharacterized protein n=1 Tax=Octopus vulgaris TaxID=6645 RepID=A0AA36EYM4_OCTVU|nr:Hypothetical predicted protein [Octopus vulgaris]